MSNCPYCGQTIRGQNENQSRQGRGPFRIETGKKLLGVCGGLADYFGWSRLWVRVGAVVLLICAFAPTVVGYFLGALIMEPVDCAHDTETV